MLNYIAYRLPTNNFIYKDYKNQGFIYRLYLKTLLI